MSDEKPWGPESGEPPPEERPDTILRVAEDGSTHRYGWNPDTNDYDIDLGPQKPKREESDA